MKVIAQRGGQNYLLVETREVDGERFGRIFNVRRREMSAEQPVDAIAKFGYWVPYTGSQAVLDDLTGVRYVEGRYDGEGAGGGRGSRRAAGRR